MLASHFDEPEILPRIVERPECLAFYLYGVVDPEEHLDTSRTLEEIEFARMVLVLGPDYVITFHRKPLAAVEAVQADCVESFRLAGKTPGFIAFLFLQRCLYDYAHLNLANDNFLDIIEARLYAGRQEELASGMAVAGRNILTLKKLNASLHIVLMRLATKRSPFISPEARASFQEMLQNAQAVRDSIDSSRDMLDGILVAVQAAAANRTSEIARVLTILSGILLPLTLITGIYGMNFEHMPELRLALRLLHGPGRPRPGGRHPVPGVPAPGLGRHETPAALGPPPRAFSSRRRTAGLAASACEADGGREESMRRSRAMEPIRYAVAAVQTDQPNPIDRREMRRNTDRMLSMMDSALAGSAPFLPVRLVVFPEFAHAAPVFATVAELREKLAVPIPNEHTDRIARRRAPRTGSTSRPARCWSRTRAGRASSSTPPA